MKNKTTLAARADRYALYEQAVQCPDADLDFASRLYKKRNKRPARSLREDFCASAWLASCWVKRHKKNTAVGIDLDSEVLAWGWKRHAADLNASQRRRWTLQQADVLKAVTPGMDLVLALNFSYWIFMDRQAMRRYFHHVKKNLAPGGLLILDAFGGSEAVLEKKEKTEFKKFPYTGDQASYDPATGAFRCHIHFRFPDKSRLKKAFTYEWRFWTLPELRELLHECGFVSAVYWEGEDRHGEGNGKYSLLRGKASADPAWICYIVAGIPR